MTKKYIILRESIQQEDLTLVNIYASNMRTPNIQRNIMVNIKKEIEQNNCHSCKFYNLININDKIVQREKNNKQESSLPKWNIGSDGFN